MLRFLLSILISFILLIPLVPASVASPQICRQELAVALDNVLGQGDQLHGYQKQLSDLMSTNQSTYLLIDQVEQLARDARLEVTGICEEVSRFEQMSDFYVAAYQLPSCQALTSENSELSAKIEIVAFCEDHSVKRVDTLLESIREYLLRQAIRTSMDPVILKMRSLNTRLAVLVSEYSRLINNFFTFSFRLGDTITGKVD